MGPARAALGVNLFTENNRELDEIANSDESDQELILKAIEKEITK